LRNLRVVKQNDTYNLHVHINRQLIKHIGLPTSIKHVKQSDTNLYTVSQQVSPV